MPRARLIRKKRRTYKRRKRIRKKYLTRKRRKRRYRTRKRRLSGGTNKSEFRGGMFGRKSRPKKKGKRARKAAERKQKEQDRRKNLRNNYMLNPETQKDRMLFNAFNCGSPKLVTGRFSVLYPRRVSQTWI